ncbi:MAG: periplasmic protein TonB [Verrucomicrobiota bacterium]|nr:periplasmic protein TonB [Verrucomicrobiota bacterium]
MKPATRSLLVLLTCSCLFMPVAGFAKGLYTTYATRITQRLDRAPGLKRGSTPVPISIRYPEFPSEMERAGVAGSVSVEFTVTADGQIKDVKVEKATHTEFAEAVLAAMKTWLFHPLGKMGPGYPSSIRLVAKIDFELPE